MSVLKWAILSVIAVIASGFLGQSFQQSLGIYLAFVFLMFLNDKDIQ